jgi:hypothetical protein
MDQALKNTDDSRYTRFLYQRFAYSQFYFCSVRSINILSTACHLRQTVCSLIRECDAGHRLRTKTFWHQFDVKMAVVICLPFYVFSLFAAIRRNSSLTHDESHLSSMHTRSRTETDINRTGCGPFTFLPVCHYPW